MKLVIVESPSKAKTIKRYLGKDYKVSATLGHVMDLPKSRLAVDVKKKYKPEYEVVKGRNKTVRELRKLLPQNEQNVYLALDPDREGEAIAANVAELLKLKNPSRIVFHEITKDAVLEAMESPRKINKELVDAQKARRILDRLVGYKLSGLLWKKIWYGLSAGRVQSVATRLIVERERERLAFKPDEFWDFFASLKRENKKVFTSKLEKKNDKKYLPKNKKEAGETEKDLEKAKWTVSKVEVKEKTQHALPPFITATLQRAANSYLGYSTKRTMQLAQQLYQGVNLKGKGQVGLITYMRTDSTNLSKNAINNIRKLVGEKYGKKYLPKEPNYYKKKSRLAQEAHEAIRPTDVSLLPSDVKDLLTPQQHKLYKLIWNRAIGSQMTPMQYNAIKVEVEADAGKEKKYQFGVTGNEVKFDGFAKVTGSSLLKDDENLGQLDGVKEGETLDLKELTKEQKFTKPKPRYTEATLVRALEKYGIGRPSTYSTIISTIQSRGYVNRDGKYLFPTDVGFVVTEFLEKHFADVVDYDFTAEIEEDLDDVAQGEKKWVPVVDKVYKPLAKQLKTKEKEVDKKDVVILGDSDVKCPVCGGKMVIRLGRNGKFLSCASFPKCKGMLGIDGKEIEEKIDFKVFYDPGRCEKCGGDMKVKAGKFGKFWACENYPECKNTLPMMLNEKCPECGEHLVVRKGKWGKEFTGCSGYPKCKYIKKEKKESKKKDSKEEDRK